MNANTHLIHAIVDALIETHGEDAIDWLEGEGRAAVERGVAGWRAAIAEGAWIDRPADILVLRALRHVEHTVELEGDARIEPRIRALADEDRHGRRPGARARIGEVFAHALLRGDTGEPFESIEYAWREHGEAVRGDDNEQPWNAAPPLSGAGTRVEACFAEARYVERRVPFLDLPGRVRQAKAMADAGDERGWTPVDEGPMFRYVRLIREDGEERMVPPSLRLRTVYLVELVCPPDRTPPGASLRASNRSTWAGAATSGTGRHRTAKAQGVGYPRGAEIANRQVNSVRINVCPVPQAAPGKVTTGPRPCARRAHGRAQRRRNGAAVMRGHPRGRRTGGPRRGTPEPGGPPPGGGSGAGVSAQGLGGRQISTRGQNVGDEGTTQIVGAERGDTRLPRPLLEALDEGRCRHGGTDPHRASPGDGTKHRARGIAAERKPVGRQACRTCGG